MRLPENAKQRIMIDILGGVAGLAGGVGAVVFRDMIQLNDDLFFGAVAPRLSVDFYGLNPGLILIPALGGLIVGPLISWFAPETKGHGVPEVMEAVALRGGRIRKRVALLKVVVSSITIGSGGSAGREGPIAQIGSTIGSSLGQAFKLGPRDVRLLVVCGLSAGIAGTFNAPLGGAIFGMEVLLGGIVSFNAIPVVFASVIGAAVAAAVLGQTPAFVAPSVGSWSPPELVFYIVLGVVFGVLSVVWVRLFYRVEDVFDALPVNPRYKAAIGGIGTGVLVMFFPQYGIMGVGYGGVDLALAGTLSLGLLLVLGVAKMFATSMTIGSGGSGGIFAPSLYVGSMFGAAAGLLFKVAFPSVVQQPTTYALAGMAALFAGAAQTPLNVIIMIPEMSGDYALIPPVMASSVSSFFVAWLFLRGSSIYTLKLERRGVKLPTGTASTLESVTVGEVMTKEVVMVAPTTPLIAFEILAEESGHSGFPVVQGGRLVGMVTLGDLGGKGEEEKEKLEVKDVYKSSVVVAYPDENMRAVTDRMYRSNVGRLPVVAREDAAKVVGIISEKDVIRAEELAVERSAG